MAEGLIRRRFFHLVVVMVLIGVVVLVYSNTFHSSFHLDDFHVIVEKYKIRNLDNLSTVITGNRGVAMASFMVNYAIGGLKVESYHYLNTLIHIINALLVYLLLFYTLMKVEVGESWSRTIALSTALIFAVHPIQTQSVTYIVQRMESLSSLFYLAALLFFIKGAQTSGAVKRIILYSGIVISYILGFYSKEIAVTLPALIFLYDFYFISRGKVKELSKRWPLYLVLLICLVWFIWKSLIPVGGFGDLSEASAGFNVRGISSWEYLLTQSNVLVYYIFLLFLPVNQNLDYDFPVSRGLFELPQVEEGTVLNYMIPPPIVSIVILLIIVGGAIYMYRRAAKREEPLLKLISFFIIWFFIILSPTSSFIPIMDVIFEHRLYLSSVGIVSVFGIVLYKGVESIGSKWKRGAVNVCYLVIVCMIAVTLSVAAYKRNRIWKDEVTLWQNVIEKYPDNAQAYIDVGLGYVERGLFSEALEAYRKSIEIDPAIADAHYNAGGVYRRLGRFDEAIDAYTTAIILEPEKSLAAHNNLGIVFVQVKKIDDAISHFEKALDINPDDAGVHYNLANAYRKSGLLDEAIFEYKEVLRLAGDHFGAYNNLGALYGMEGRFEDSVRNFKKALNISPDNKEARLNLGIAYIKKGDCDSAEIELKDLLESEPDNVKIRRYLSGCGQPAIKK